MLRGRQILSKDRGKDRIEDDSRKGAKGAKFGEIEKYFLCHLCGLGVLVRKSLLKHSVEHFSSKNLSHVTGAAGLAGQ